jgi:glycosyltransferase involved in cell wall biosynthesis
MGRPVIASRLGGPEELVLDGETGVLLPAGDVAALAEAIAALADNAESRQAMGTAGMALAARQFDAETNARSVVALYDALRDSATEA